MKPTLAIMASGIGSRYGGLKQIDPVGPNGEIIIDYSIYDALKAGFGKVVFIINRDIEKAFKENIGCRIEKVINTTYVYQSVEDLPEGFKIPVKRTKPWGTAHAVLCCRNVIKTPFAVINADDFYGSRSFLRLAEYLKDIGKSGIGYQYCMVGFQLENTLTENGYVSRGVCSVDTDGYLNDIYERTRIQKFGKVAKYSENGEDWIEIPAGSIVSMNMWGFTTDFFHELEQQFPLFLRNNRDNILKAEYFLPTVVNRLISSNKAKVKVLPTDEKWYGVTYKEDKPFVKEAILNRIQQGIYPKNLWEEIL
mgnify:FL=1